MSNATSALPICETVEVDEAEVCKRTRVRIRLVMCEAEEAMHEAEENCMRLRKVCMRLRKVCMS